MRQVGPFALVQRPPKPVVEQLAMRLGSQRTMIARSTSPEEMQLAVLLHFEDLRVATLPPLRPEEALSVGRMPSCDLVINDPSVSKVHALLRWLEAKAACTVEDLKSTNGTQLNGKPLPPGRQVYVRDGDLLRFGEADFAYFESASLWSRLMR